MSEAAEVGGSKNTEDICRDFLRNVCRRGDRLVFWFPLPSPEVNAVFYFRCKFSHPTERAESDTDGGIGWH